MSDLTERVAEFLAAHDPTTTDRWEFLRARFDAGLARINWPVGLGGLGLDPGEQGAVDAAFVAAGAPDNRPALGVIGLGMAAPTILRHGDEDQKRRWMRPLWTGEEIWCQLFSEPGSGSDLASLSTRAVPDGDEWVVNGQKVWTSLAHLARWAILVTRTDPAVPKHQGLTYFVLDMTAPGVEVRPLRQLTGESEFNEVFLTDVRIPDSQRLGAVGEGWAVSQTTLMSERVSIGGGRIPRGGMLEPLIRTWRDRPELRTAGLHDQLLELWVEAESARLASTRLKQQIAAGRPGPEGSAAKLAYADLNQRITALELQVLAGDGLRYEDSAGHRYLRARANSIEGGTSEILRNIVAERVLGLPGEIRTDKDVPWKDLPR
ncbi:MAG TPA: acyl-CoA dehydrogenase family protein [Sporichthyaceae bacterium]|nr:acyl-CoA dehydrogenase family protein [Sporichthyaceae bacterium]